jgi:hypothetical protein
MGRVPVAHLLASEARRSPPGWPGIIRDHPSVLRLQTPLTVFSRAINRESLAGCLATPSNYYYYYYYYHYYYYYYYYYYY